MGKKCFGKENEQNKTKLKWKNRNQSRIEGKKMKGEKTNLNIAMVFVVREAERAESAVHAIQAVHIAFALVRIGVQLALHEEALFQQRLQPWRPPAVVLLLLWTLRPKTEQKKKKTTKQSQKTKTHRRNSIKKLKRKKKIHLRREKK